MAEVSKKLAIKTQVENALDLRDENRKKKQKPQTFDLGYFIRKSYFDVNRSQNYLIFPPVFKYFQSFSVTFDNSLGLNYHNFCSIRQ